MRNNFSKLLVLLLIVGTTGTACEPLRKKFQRKKKEDKKDSAFVPVLQPEEYATPEFDPMAAYKHRYNLWNLWYEDFMIALDEEGTVKRQQYLVGQMIIQLEEMAKLLSGEPQAAIENHKKTLQELQVSLASPIRNAIVTKNKLNTVNSEIRENFKPEKVQDKLLQP